MIGRDEPDEWSPASQSELQRFLASNVRSDRKPLFPVGGRTSLGLGYPPRGSGVQVSTLRLARTIDYPARDMTITVEAGLRVSELARQLQGERQQLPIDVPLAHRATIGGAVAKNISGPRRFGYGTLRDYLIGMTAVDGTGRQFHAGGRVVKNVAGYDLCKLMVGSLGTLAIVSQVTFKLKPIPETAGTIWATFKDFASVDSAASKLLTSVARPVLLEVLNPLAARQITSDTRLDLARQTPVLVVRVEGTSAEVTWQVDAVRNELTTAGASNASVLEAEDSARLLDALTGYRVSADDPLTFQANLLPSQSLQFAQWATQEGMAVQLHAGNGIVIGHLSDETATATRADRLLAALRAFARQHRGNLVILNCDPAWKRDLPLFGDPEPAWPLMQRIKQALDPHNLLNPGRFLYGR